MKRKASAIQEEANVLKNVLLKPGYHKTRDLIKIYNPEISIRTLQRKLDEIKKNEVSYYLVGNKRVGWRLMKREVILKKIKNSQKEQKANLGYADNLDVYNPKMSGNIYQLYEAMNEGCYIELNDYSPVSSKGNKDYIVYPITMNLTYKPEIFAYDKQAKKFKTFIIGQINNTVLLEDDKVPKYIKNKSHEKCIDSFNFHCDKKELVPVELLMTNYAKAMTERDFPQLGRFIISLNLLEDKIINDEGSIFSYSLRLHVCNEKVVGRLITGMLNNFIVYEAPDEFRRQLEEYVKNAVLDNWRKSIYDYKRKN